MATVNIYLNFLGECEEAFLFYKSVFGGEFSYLGRFKDMPKQQEETSLPKEMENKIMHVGLPISKETILMGSDTCEAWTKEYKRGNNFSISVNLENKEEADRIFKLLSEDGEIQVPMADAFWGDYFGQLNDKYGINWMVMCSSE